jgi:hypothetical protein
MGTLILHAGRPKTGSTAIQRWIEQQAAMLRREHAIDSAVIRVDPSHRVQVVPYRRGPVTSWLVVKHYRESGRARSVIDELMAKLDAELAGSRTLLLTAEHFGDLLRRPDANFAEGLNELARTHVVRVAYYVRPQHTAVEGHWKQWGFRFRDQTPAKYVSTTSRGFRYLRTLECAQQMMPRVSFEMRPFRRDLLDGEDVVVDFGRRFLGLSSPPTEAIEPPINQGIPLEVANLLHCAPPWLVPQDHSGLRQLELLQRYLAGSHCSESDEIRRSRLIVQQYCHDEHEADNEALIRHLDWPTTHFVPHLESNDRQPGDLEELDELWRPHASEWEREVLHRVLADVLGPARLPENAGRSRLRSYAARLRPRTWRPSSTPRSTADRVASRE